eukprot:jgi/Ulvmu1/12013/UM083_0026.1
MQSLLPDKVQFPNRSYIAPVPYHLGTVAAESFFRCVGTQKSGVLVPGPTTQDAEVVYLVMSSCGPNSTVESVLSATRGVHGINFEATVKCPNDNVEAPWYQGRLDVDTWLIYCAEMLELVRCLHSRNIVHGDIKLSNFCILPHNSSDPLKLIMIDFGFASTLSHRRTHLPRHSHFKGTPDYASVRMLLCEQTTFIDDLEALVYCFMELLCGDLPWRFDRDVATAKPVEFEIFAKQREKLWLKHSKHIPKAIFEMMLVVMRETIQQRASMGFECSNCVYTNLHTALKAARDAMAFELQAMQPTGLMQDVYGHVEPTHLGMSHGQSGVANGLLTHEEVCHGGGDIDVGLVANVSKKRPAGSKRLDSPKRTKLAMNMASQAEQ